MDLVGAQRRAQDELQAALALSDSRLGVCVAHWERLGSLLCQLAEVGWRHVEHTNPDFSSITLTHPSNPDAALRVTLTPEGGITADDGLPSWPSLDQYDSPAHRIAPLFTTFQKRLASLEPIWRHLDSLDHRTRVLSTGSVQPSQLFRIVSVQEGVWLHVSYQDPNPDQLPHCLLFGPDDKIEPFRQKLHHNAHLFDPDLSLADNLRLILEAELAAPLTSHRASLDRSALASIECKICLDVFLDGAPASLVCSCSIHFHQQCLERWLKSTPDAVRLRSEVKGRCPYCTCIILCPLLS